MSRARAQSSKRRMMRQMFSNQSETNSTKHPGLRLQIINVSLFPKKKGRKSNRQKWLESLPLHLGKIKFIHHKKLT